MKKTLMVTATIFAMTGMVAPNLALTSIAAESEITQSAAIDYRPADIFLSKFINVERGRPKIFYQAVRENAGPFLKSYVNYLSSQNVDQLSKDDQLAYWLNVQNILAVQAISFDTKKTILKKLRGTGDDPGVLWSTPRFSYGGEKLSLADIENRIASRFDNPDVIYGLYQGVRGGPSISLKAYQGSTVYAQLEEAGQKYVNSSGTVRAKSETAKLAPVYLWHKDTLFGGDDAAIISHIRTHASPRLATKLEKAQTVKSAKLNYRSDNFQVPRPTSNAGVNSGGSSGGAGFGS